MTTLGRIEVTTPSATIISIRIRMHGEEMFPRSKTRRKALSSRVPHRHELWLDSNGEVFPVLSEASMKRDVLARTSIFDVGIAYSIRRALVLPGRVAALGFVPDLGFVNG